VSLKSFYSCRCEGEEEIFGGVLERILNVNVWRGMIFLVCEMVCGEEMP